MTSSLARGGVFLYRAKLLDSNRKKVLRAYYARHSFDKERNMGIISYIKEEIQVIRERDPAIKSNMEVFLYPSFRVILRYRLAHKLYLKGHYFWARWISQRGGAQDGDRDPSRRNNRERIVHRPWKRCYHW